MGKLVNHTSLGKLSYAHSFDPQAMVIRSGEFLFRMGDALGGIYLVNSGSVKVSRTTEVGEEQIIGFYMPGQIIGLDALSSAAADQNSTSQCTAVALEISNVSLLTVDSILANSSNLGSATFMQKIASTFRHENDHSLMLSCCTASRRLAWFITEFSANLDKRGLSPRQFDLPMTRTDIATYLGLAVETVSRELARFCKEGYITKSIRHIEMLDLPRLQAIANGEPVSISKKSCNLH